MFKNLLPSIESDLEEINEQAKKQITRATSHIVIDDPFYGYILLKLNLRQNIAVGTMGTDGVSLMYNPLWVVSLDFQELIGVIKHEIMHVASCHHVRRQQRDPEKWNWAGDYVINDMLIQAGTILPEGGLHNEEFRGFGTEHVYSLIPDPPAPPINPRGKGKGKGDGDGPCWGKVFDHPGAADPTEAEQIEQDVRNTVVQAANAAKNVGKEPAGLEDLIDKIRESKLPWKSILARLLRTPKPSGETWLRPNRRYASQGVILPSKNRRMEGTLVFGLDTSASVSVPELEALCGVISSVMKTGAITKIHVVYCDAAVEGVQEFTKRDLPIEPKKFDIKGRGGTSFKPVFDWVEENNIKPDALLYLTDMYAPFDFDPPPYPTFWCATSDVVAPWGKTIEIVV